MNKYTEAFLKSLYAEIVWKVENHLNENFELVMIFNHILTSLDNTSAIINDIQYTYQFSNIDAEYIEEYMNGKTIKHIFDINKYDISMIKDTLIENIDLINKKLSRNTEDIKLLYKYNIKMPTFIHTLITIDDFKKLTNV